MTRSLLGLFFSFIFYCAQGQLTFSPEVVNITGNPGQDIISTKIALTNNSNADVVFFWRLTKSENFPSAWQTQVCDFNLCYAEDIDQSNPDLSNTLKAGVTGDLILYVLPNNESGEASMTLTLYSDKDLTNELIKIETSSILISNSTSVNDVRAEEVVLYPNPSDDYFQIRNDQEVRKVVLYNIVGKEVKQFNHNPGMAHNIEYLNKGMYLVRMFDRKGDVLKSLRLSKR